MLGDLETIFIGGDEATVEVPTGGMVRKHRAGAAGGAREVAETVTCYPSARAAARAVGVSNQTVCKWIRRGRLQVLARSETLAGVHGYCVAVVELKALVRERERLGGHKNGVAQGGV